MQELRNAEIIDRFFDVVKNDPVNSLARKNLSYTAFNENVDPWFGNTVIVTMHPSAEGGMPHTRPPNIICMPVYYPDSRKEETLKHEYIHIDQRRRKSVWDNFFRKEGWSRVDESEVPDRWRNRCRLNPDTFDQRFWAWKGQYVPLPLFEREDKPDLRQVSIQWWDRESGVRMPQAPRLFMEKYGTAPAQPEHPRELAAVELAHSFQTQNDLDSYLGL